MKYTKELFDVRYINGNARVTTMYVAEGGKVGFYKLGWSCYEVLHLASNSNCGRTRTIANAKRLAELFLKVGAMINFPMDEADVDKLRDWMRDNFVAMGPFIEGRKEFLK